MKELTKEVLKKAREKYLERYITPPEQFNLAYSEVKGWRAEFHYEDSNWSEGFTTWLSGYEVLNLFFSLDVDDIDISGWDEDWNDEKK